MVNNVPGEWMLTELFAMLLNALFVRSTTQKDESLSDSHNRILSVEAM
jgi:hypothetical protein